jgi:hypothetical protein
VKPVVVLAALATAVLAGWVLGSVVFIVAAARWLR